MLYYRFRTRASLRLPSDQATLQRTNMVGSDAAVINTLLVSATNDTSCIDTQKHAWTLFHHSFIQNSKLTHFINHFRLSY